MDRKSEHGHYGGGGTLVGGWRKWFVEVNANYTQTDMGFNNNIETLLTSMRAGWHGKVGSIGLQAWGGVSYWMQSRTVSDEILLPGGGVLTYVIDQEPKDKITGIIGLNVDLSKNFTFLVETEFAPSTFLISGGPTWRF